MRFGVDLSEHQAGFLFSAPEAATLDFAILRTTDGTYQDHAFATLLADARYANLSVAAYHFLRSPKEGTTIAQQVAAACEVLGSARDLAVWLDVESPAGLRFDDVAEAATRFCQAGVRVAGVYTTAAYWRRHMLLKSPRSIGEGKLWLAQWGSDDATLPSGWPTPLGLGAPDIWQYTSRGEIGGFRVDLNAAR